MDSKTCSKCHGSKPLAEFTRANRRRDGAGSHCKGCHNAANSVRCAANPEKRNAQVRARRAANPEKERAYSRERYAANRDQKLAADRAYRLANPEKGRASSRAYYAANRERLATYKRAYRAANPEKVAATNRAWQVAHPANTARSDRRRSARKRGNGVFTVTAKDERRLLAQPCYLCHTTASTTLDHIIAIDRGGRHSIGNLAGACRPCNSAKHTMHLIEYRAKINRRTQAAA